MKKKLNACYCRRQWPKKMLRVMKIGFFLLVLGLTSVHATTFSQQKVSLDVKNETLLRVLDLLQEQSGYTFLFSSEDVKEVKNLSIRVKNKNLFDVLGQCLQGTHLSYEVNEKLVVLRLASRVDEPEKKSVRIKGYVRDAQKAPIPGVTVKVEGLTLGTATNTRGWFALDLPMLKGRLEFTFVGYKKKIVDFTEKMVKDTLQITLEEEMQTLDETVVVAFGEQKKESVVSAITTVRPMDLKSSSSDLTSSFAGKIAGIVGWQTGGIPGALTEEEMNTKFYIRGITSFQTGANIDPLILLDGVESSKLDLSRISPEDIESFSVMKDASATAMYGARGANGVILVTTKKGEEGNVYTSVRYEAVMSMPTREIDVVSPVDYMKLYNEAKRSRDPNAAPEYSVLDISRRESKNYPSWAYPANDWYDILFKDYNINHRLGVNIRGGSRVMQYYSSVNYVRDMGMLKTDKLNEFDVNIKNSTLSFRANLNVNLHPNIKLLLNSVTNWDKYHGPLTDVKKAYELAFKANPVRFAPTYPADETYNWKHIRFGNYGSGGASENPYESIHMGYVDRNRYSVTNKLEYIHNLSSLLKGLEVRGSVSLANVGYYYLPYQTKPFEYELRKYDEGTGKHTLYALNANDAKRTIEMGEKEHTSETQLTWELRALHTAAWGNHQTSLTAVFNALEASSSAPNDFLNSVENRNMGFPCGELTDLRTAISWKPVSGIMVRSVLHGKIK